MSKLKIYLAGKMSGLNFEEMNNWRVKATGQLKQQSDNQIHTINPVDYYNFTMNPDTYSDKEVMRFDLHQVKNCDVVLVNLTTPDSIGTAIELYAAHNNWDIPVVGFGDMTNVHPWMFQCLDKTCDSLVEAVQYICDYYLPNI